MLVRVELELEDWMAKAVIEFVMKLEKNAEFHERIKARMVNGSSNGNGSGDSKSGDAKGQVGSDSKKNPNTRNKLLKRAWLLCNRIARLESTPEKEITKEMVWNKMKEKYGIKSSKDLSNDELRRFVDQIELYYNDVANRYAF